MDNQKNIVALTENELENISGGKQSKSYFKKGFLVCFGVLSAFIVFGLIGHGIEALAKRK